MPARPLPDAALDLPAYRRPAGVHPPLDSPGYRSTALRHPREPLVPLPRARRASSGSTSGCKARRRQSSSMSEHMCRRGAVTCR